MTMLHLAAGAGLTVLVGVLLLSVSVHGQTGSTADIQIRYGNLGYQDGYKFIGHVTVTNSGNNEFQPGDQDVNIYVCLIRLVKKSDSPGGVEVMTSQGSTVSVTHLDGCTHRITLNGPVRIDAGGSMSFNMTQEFWLVAYTDVMPNWYIQIGDGDFELVQNTKGDQINFVDPFEKEDQFMRYNEDKVLPWTPSYRFDEFSRKGDFNEARTKLRLVPSFSEDLAVSDDTDFVGPFNSYQDVDTVFIQDPSLSRDEHQIQVFPNKTVQVLANSESSYRQALSTIQQMIERFDRNLPVGMSPMNKPRSEIRGLMLDLARHFHDKDTVKSVLDLMWRYKLNTLHLHLTDDESWSLEIDGLLELTEIGSKQCFDNQRCGTYPQLGREVSSSDEKLYLLKEDYIEIVAYADEKGIMVIPEVDVPGHSTAAIQAMKLRQEQGGGDDFRLDDPDDTSEYLTVQYFKSSAVNPCINTSYAFVERVIQVLKDYHQEAGQPLTLIHLGGDEVPKAWIESPICQSLLNATNQTHSYLKKQMLQRFGDIVHRHNLSFGMWEDGLMDKDKQNLPYDRDEIFHPDLDVYAFTWQTVWEWGGGSRPYNMANGGYKVVLTPATRFYLDHPQEPDQLERGYYWARRFTNLKRAFNFRVDNFYENINGMDVQGNIKSREKFCKSDVECPPLEKPENIVGGEAALFGETIFNKENLDNNVWPRLLAIAERLWKEASWESKAGEHPAGFDEDFTLFQQALETYEVPYLERTGVQYHLSPPAFTVDQDGDSADQYKVQFRTEFGNQKVWVRNGEDSERTEVKVTEGYTYSAGDQVYISVSDGAGNRFSRELHLYREPTNSSAQPASYNFYSTSTTLLTLALNVALKLVFKYHWL